MDLRPELEIAEALLRKAPVDEWEAVATQGEQISLAVKGDELDKFEDARSRSVSIRVVREGRMGFAYAMGGGEEAIARAVEEASASALASDLEFTAGLARPQELPGKMETFDPRVLEEPLEAKKKMAFAMAKAAREADPRVVHVHPAEIETAAGWVHLRNSHGLDLQNSGTAVSAAAVALAKEGDEQEMDWDADTARFWGDLDPVALGVSAGKRAAALLGAGPIPDGRYPVILENRVAIQFLGLLAVSFMGDSLAKGRSLLAGRLGEKVLSERVSIVDDGLYPRGLGSAPFDSEGTPQSRTVLVENGVLRGFVFDRLWAGVQGAASTGNAVRGSSKAPPSVGFTNLMITPGQGSAQSLAAGLDRGFMLTEVMGGHTADPVSGEFSFGAAGWLIENGQLARPVKSMAVAGQVLDLFGAVEAVGDDLRFMGRTASPSLLVSRLSLSGP